MDNITYYQRNREIMLNKVKDCYENDKERLRVQARNKYRNLSEDDKDLSEEDKKKKREYRKIDIIICLKKRSKNWKNTKNQDIKK